MVHSHTYDILDWKSNMGDVDACLILLFHYTISLFQDSIRYKEFVKLSMSTQALATLAKYVQDVDFFFKFIVFICMLIPFYCWGYYGIYWFDYGQHIVVWTKSLRILFHLV